MSNSSAKIHDSLKKLFTGFPFWLGFGEGSSPSQDRFFSYLLISVTLISYSPACLPKVATVA
jgi:hypothetical protein